jgi:hypothetical protein
MIDFLIGLALTTLLLRLAARVGERAVVPVRTPPRRP